MDENSQKIHYEMIHDDYAKHYYDPTSMEFRDKFMYKYLFKGLDLNNKKVADLASGSGYNSLALMKYFPKVQVFGFDISKKACQDYKKTVGRPAYEIDLTKKTDLKEEYDCAMIIGGLHHCVSDLEATFENISAILKPGGSLLMIEPNKNYFLEPLRKLWYKLDKYFEENTEEALDHDSLLFKQAQHFNVEKIFYLGGPAYFLIYNSLLFRLPIRIKKVVAPILLLLEKIYNLCPGKVMFPYFIAQWKKK